MEAFGRLGNRLFLGAHLLAYSAQHGNDLLNLAFGSYASDFPWLDGNAAFAYPWRETGGPSDATRMQRLAIVQELLPWSRRFRYWGQADWDLDLGGVGGPTRDRHRRVFVRGWRIRAPGSLSEKRSLVHEVFRPQPAVVGQLDESIPGWRIGCDRLVAVHLRWEDYRGTPHYRSPEEFRLAMGAMAQAHPGTRTRFVLFSSENLEGLDWPELDVVRSPSYSVMFDLYAMARCDHIIAPPSTFSGWASYYGGVPLSRFSRLDGQVVLEDGGVILG